MAKNQNNDVQEEEVRTSKSSGTWWSWVVGAAGGAVVVGAVWAVTAYQHPTDPVVAKVGNTTFAKSAFTGKLETIYGSQVLTQLIQDQLIKDAATKNKLTASTDEINTAMSQFEAQYGISDPTQLSMMLAQNNMTMADLQDILKTQVLESKLATLNVTASDAEIQSYYNAHKSDYTPQGSKTPQPLSAVKSQVEEAVKQSKAPSPQQLLANLAKSDPITILDTKYNSVKTQIETPPVQTAPTGQ